MRWRWLVLVSLVACSSQALVTPFDGGVMRGAPDLSVSVVGERDAAVAFDLASEDGPSTACRGLDIPSCEASPDCVGYSCACHGGPQQYAGCFDSQTDQTAACALFCK
jgi:hypothetical protein